MKIPYPMSIKSSLKLLKSNTQIISLNEDELILNINDQFENNQSLISFRISKYCRSIGESQHLLHQTNLTYFY